MECEDLNSGPGAPECHRSSLVPYTLGSPVLPTQCLIWTRPVVLLIFGLSTSFDSNQKYNYPFYSLLLLVTFVSFFFILM